MKKKNNIHNNIDWNMFLEEDRKEKINDKLQDILKKIPTNQPKNLWNTTLLVNSL